MFSGVDAHAWFADMVVRIAIAKIDLAAGACAAYFYQKGHGRSPANRTSNSPDLLQKRTTSKNRGFRTHAQ